MDFDIFNYFICLLEALSVLLFFRIIDNRTFSIRNYLIVFFIIGASSILVTFIDAQVNYSIVLLNFAIFFVAFWVGFRRSIKETFFNSVFSFMILLYMQSISLLFIPLKWLGTNLGNFMGDSSIIILAVILNILSYKFHWAEKYKSNFKIAWIFLVSLCVPEIITAQLLSFRFIDSSRQTIIILVLLQIVYMSIVITLLSIVQHRNNHARLEQTQKHINDLNSHLDDSRKSMHDFNKHIRYLHSMVMLNSTDNELRKNVDSYCKELLNIYNEEEILLQLDEPIFRALLYGRRTQAIRNGIEFILDATSVLPQFPIENFRFVEIFDNLIDNAFECVTQLSTSNKWIKVGLSCERGREYMQHMFLIENPCEDTNISEIVNAGAYSSKGGKHMGLGLKKVTRLVNDTGGRILISSDNNIFSIKVVYEVYDITK